MKFKSKYKNKRKNGSQMMYGPGCCAHGRPANHMQERVDALRKARGDKQLTGSESDERGDVQQTATD